VIVGFHSPLPPQRTGVADYSAALLGALSRLGEVRPDAKRADVQLYHTGNNGLHRAIYQRALEEPGVVVLHDAVLHHFLLGTLSEAEYLEEFVYNYGEWARGHAAELWARRARSGIDPEYFRYPMLRRLAERSRALIVHNAAAARLVHEHAPQAEVEVIPHLYAAVPVPAASEVLASRRSWGAGLNTTVFGVFGHLRETKRVASVLRAFARVPNARLVIAGEPVSDTYARTIEPLVREAGAIRLPYQSEAEFNRNAAAIDVCINLRYPAAGETSGIAVRMMGAGRCVVVTEGEESADIPEGACIRIDPGVAEQPMLEAMMVWLAEDREAAREIGRRAAAHIREHHNLDRVAQLYWKVLQDARG
jgi:glycosyltransferase involved in cell wall biosynthesis